jgi:hypothetical protein
LKRLERLLDKLEEGLLIGVRMQRTTKMNPNSAEIASRRTLAITKNESKLTSTVARNR